MGALIRVLDKYFLHKIGGLETVTPQSVLTFTSFSIYRPKPITHLSLVVNAECCCDRAVVEVGPVGRSQPQRGSRGSVWRVGLLAKLAVAAVGGSARCGGGAGRAVWMRRDAACP